VTWDPDYLTEDGWLLHRYTLETGNVLRFAARNVRRERTGTHAMVAISLNWVQLGYSDFNVDRDEDRVRLANSAYKHLDGDSHTLDRAEMPANIFKHALDLFAFGLWEETVSVDIGGMMEGDPDTPAATLLLGHYILKDAGTILFAPPGAGKSYTAMSWAVSLMWASSSIWAVPAACVPLYINVERSALSMAGRLARVNTAFGYDPRTPLPFLNARGKSLADIYEAAKKTIEKEGSTVVLYDSISRAGNGSMVQDDVANKTMDMLNALSPTWVALGHSPRGDETHAFGSQMFDAAADLTVQLKSQTSKDKLTTGISLEVIKANDTSTGHLAVHVFDWAPTGRPGETELGGIRKGKQGEFSELEAGERMGLEDQIAQMVKTGAMSGTDIADGLGKNRSYISRLLSSSDRFQRVEKAGHSVLYGLRQP
jgi:hypothetical protein